MIDMARMLRNGSLKVAVCSLLALGACFGIGPATRAAHARQQPAPPPEIQRILDKAKGGGRLTMDEIKKLTDWSKKLQERFNNPAATGSQIGIPGRSSAAGIPCDISMTSSYSISHSDKEGSEREDCQVAIHAKAVLFAVVKGQGNYFKDILNPDVDASSFRFEPELGAARAVAGGGQTPTLSGIGGGSLHDHRTSMFKNGHSDSTIDGHLEKAVGSMLFVTVGSDRLFCTAAFGGVLNGTEREVTVQGNQSDSRTHKAATNAFGGSGEAGVPFASESVAFAKASTTHQPPDVSAIRSDASFARLASAVASGKSQTITINENFSVVNSAGRHIDGTSTVRITLRPPPLELIVEPESYDQWVPQGGATEDAAGNKLNIKATLMAKGGKPLASKISPKKFTFQLENVSREPGVCMNWPVTKPDDDSKPDLKFEAGENPNFAISGAHGETAVSTKPDVSVTARLTSFDWGGWCDLKVTAELADGTIFEGHLKMHENESVVRLPKRKEGMHVADAWKEYMSKSCGRDVTGLDDNDDSENLPVGDGHKGDGYALYEEYRGLMEAGKHFRASPGRKKLFVRDEVGDRSKDGIALFRQATNIEVHDEFTLEEFGRPNSDANDYVRTKIMNENRRDGAHVVDQHGIVLLQSLEQVSYAQAVLKVEIGPLGPPKNYKYIEITPTFDPGPDGWQSVTQGGGKTVSDNYAHTIAHEMLHCCAVPHHGDSDVGRVLIQRIGNGRGAYFAMGGDTSPIDLKYETGVPVPSDNPYFDKPRHPWLAVSHGQHSGAEDCLMCYDCASLIKLDGSAGAAFVYLFPADRQLAGLGLCSSPSGTGVNAPGRRPRPRFGDADAGRGDCAHRICVNDLFY